MPVTNEEIEAAAVAAFNSKMDVCGITRTWDNVRPQAQASWRNYVRPILEAAAKVREDKLLDAIKEAAPGEGVTLVGDDGLKYGATFTPGRVAWEYKVSTGSVDIANIYATLSRDPSWEHYQTVYNPRSETMIHFFKRPKQ